MMEKRMVPTGIRNGEPLEDSIRKIEKVARLYGMEATFDRVAEFKTYSWVRHQYLRESCMCLGCRLERHLFKLMEAP